MRFFIVIGHRTTRSDHQRHGLPFKTVALEFADEEAAKDWIDANQLGRRNLPPHLASLLRGRIYNREKKAHGGERKASGHFVHLPKTAERLAKQFHVDEKTIRRDGKRAEAMDKLAETHPEEAKAVRDGCLKLAHAYHARHTAGMDSRTPTEAARDFFRRLTLPMDFHGAKVLLADYPDQETYSFLKTGDDWPIAFHRKVNQGVAREFRKRNARVEFVTVTLSGFFDWLAKYDLPNTAATRAQYISWLTAPDPKPTPTADAHN